jgi:hypothetical protein
MTLRPPAYPLFVITLIPAIGELQVHAEVEPSNQRGIDLLSFWNIPSCRQKGDRRARGDTMVLGVGDNAKGVVKCRYRSDRLT